LECGVPEPKLAEEGMLNHVLGRRLPEKTGRAGQGRPSWLELEACMRTNVKTSRSTINAHNKRPKKNGGFSGSIQEWWKMLFQYVIAPILIAYAGYTFGSLSEAKKYNLEKDKYTYEQRARVWSSLTKHYPSYFQNWNRLRIISDYERSGHELDPESIKRKDRYVLNRDIARENLINSLFEAKLIFSDICSKQIDTFIEFDKAQCSLEFSKLAPMSKWESAIIPVLTKIQEEAQLR
jgi:hypothetical protein